MKKDKEWLIKRVENYIPLNDKTVGHVVDNILDIIRQLDEPEVLSQEWIDRNKEPFHHFENNKVDYYASTDSLQSLLVPKEESINIVLDDLKEYIEEQQSLSQNVGMAHTPSANDTYYRKYDFVLECIDEYEPSGDLQSLLVPKQELPVIPSYMAEYLELAKSEVSLMRVLEIANRRDELPKWEKEYDWISANGEAFARAWLDGYTAEEEPLYTARLKAITDEYIASYLRTQSSDDENRLNLLEIGNKYIYEDYRHQSEFTEDELKKLGIWDSDQWIIEEVEEWSKN